MCGLTMMIRLASKRDLDAVMSVEKEAFGEEAEAHLVRDLMGDPTAEPRYAFIAFEKDQAIGHVLFTAVRLEGATSGLSLSILAPLAVIPEFQKQGVGGRLIAHGVSHLAKEGVALVFVLGHPDYYPRHGFTPAGEKGFEAPYPILEKNAGAWMVKALKPGVIGTVSGRVKCAAVMDHPEYWRE